MQVTEGTLGRVLALRLEDGEEIVECVESAARDHGVSQGIVWLVGAARDGKMVVGPKRLEIPPKRWMMSFDDGRELVAVGTLFPSDGEATLHLHGALGRSDSTLTGCIQRGSRAFLIVEAFIIEVVGIGGRRELDPSGALRLLRLGDGHKSGGQHTSEQ